MSESLHFAGEGKEEAVKSSLMKNPEKDGLIQRTPHNTFFSEKDFNQELDVFRLINFSTQEFKEKKLSNIFFEKSIFLFNGIDFSTSSQKATERSIHNDDRFFVQGNDLYIIPRKHKGDKNIIAATDRIFPAETGLLEPEKKKLFWKKIDATTQHAEKLGIKEEYIKTLDIALHLFLHNPKNFSLTPSQFDALCTEMRIFYTRKMFAEMSGDEFREWERKKKDAGIAALIDKEPTEFQKSSKIFSTKIDIWDIPDINYEWNIKSQGTLINFPENKEGKRKEVTQVLNLHSFLRTKDLQGKTYNDYLSEIEYFFEIPHPGLLRTLLMQESQGDMFALSSSYAMGLFQLLPMVRDDHDDNVPEFHGNVNPFNPYMSALRAAEKLVELKNGRRVIGKTKKGKNIYSENKRTWRETVEDYYTDTDKKDYANKILSQLKREKKSS